MHIPVQATKKEHMHLEDQIRAEVTVATTARKEGELEQRIAARGRMRHIGNLCPRSISGAGLFLSQRGEVCGTMAIVLIKKFSVYPMAKR